MTRLKDDRFIAFGLPHLGVNEKLWTICDIGHPVSDIGKYDFDIAY